MLVEVVVVAVCLASMVVWHGSVVGETAVPVAKLDSECRMGKLVAAAAAAPVRPEAAPVAKLAVAKASPVARAAVAKLVRRDTAPVAKLAAKLAERAVAKFAVAKFAVAKGVAVLDVAIVRRASAVAPFAMQHSSPPNKPPQSLQPFFVELPGALSSCVLYGLGCLLLF